MRPLLAAPLMIMTACATTFDMTEPAPEFDLLIIGGLVCADGESEPVRADVGVVGERIASVEADLSGHAARTVIDATGLLVVPGFIDTHSHADEGGPLTEYLQQGVTTVIAGNCGRSPRVETWSEHCESLAGGLGPNWAALVGHNQVRAEAGVSVETPTPEQLTAMVELVEAAMQEGALGLSTGLIYATGYNSSTEEIIPLAAAAAAHGGVYATHMRGEDERVLQSVREAIRITRAAECRTQISHVKCAGPEAWGLAGEFLALVDAANAEGLHVWMDQYPYTASQTTIDVLFPDWARNAWESAVAERRGELEEGVRELLVDRGGPERVFMVSGPFALRFLSDVAAERGADPEDVLIDEVGAGGARAVYHMMTEEDLLTFMPHPLVMIGSDGPTISHPRGFGTFPRFWGHFARGRALFTPREAVMKTSTLAARQFRLDEQQRGVIRPGFFADIAVLDWDVVSDDATFEEPTLPPTGVEHVVVNGRLALREGAPTDVTAGRVLRLTDSKSHRSD